MTSCSSEGPRKGKLGKSKKPRNTGRITKKEHPASISYEARLYPVLRDDDKTLSRGGNPEVNTLRKILTALGMKVEFVKA